MHTHRGGDEILRGGSHGTVNEEKKNGIKLSDKNEAEDWLRHIYKTFVLAFFIGISCDRASPTKCLCFSW